MDQWQGFWETVKVVGPLLTGGLAGAILTYVFNQRIARRRIPRLDLNIEKINYALGSNSDAFDNLKVSYKGRDHENLLLYQMEVKNTSAKTVSNTPILLLMSKDCEIIDQSTSTFPTKRQIILNRAPDTENAYVWDAGELKPSDSAKIRMLLSPTAEIDWSWRGEDDVEITSRGQEGSLAAEREIKSIVFWIALFLASGSLPVFGGFAQALMLLFTAPFIVAVIQRVRYYISNRDDKINIRTGSNSSVLMATGGSRIDSESTADPAKPR